MDILKQLVKEFSIEEKFAENIIKLVDDGNTIPFIARYRKELTGACSDYILRDFVDRLNYLRRLNERKEEIINSIKERNLYTKEIAAEIRKTKTQAELEDLYRPFKQKKETRAAKAIANGLEPLAKYIFAQDKDAVEAEAKKYVQKEIKSIKEAIDGALDIIAEWISDEPKTRALLKNLIEKKGSLNVCYDKAKENSRYSMYEKYTEAVSTIPSHRILAINRGEKENELKVALIVPIDEAKKIFYDFNVKQNSKTEKYILQAIDDAFKRLIFHSVEREVRSNLNEKANEQAIKMFELNLKPLLMQAPIKGKKVMGFDPAYRTGCKLAVVDENGKFLRYTVIYPTPPKPKEDAADKFKDILKEFDVDIIALGNGTASKESEIFIAENIKTLDKKVQYTIVNEAGASVYSASELARAEFPQLDTTIRGAISLARRLQDPLAELIKIDVKSIGVGQYQHDMPQNRLTEVLNGVVEDCVNTVGVDLDTASVELLTYVSGLNKNVAQNIIQARVDINTKNDLKNVKGIGNKVFEQCAGFLRIPHSENILDKTGIHPESYEASLKLLNELKYSDDEIKKGAFSDIKDRLHSHDINTLASKLGIGVPTINDIIDELVKPGRDIRESLSSPVLRTDVISIDDLEPGMEFDGIVRNVIDFGAFVDIGVHQDGLVHISEMSYNLVKKPSDIVMVGDKVRVKILSVDANKGQIALSMKFDKPKISFNKDNRKNSKNVNKVKLNNKDNKNNKSFNNKKKSVKNDIDSSLNKLLNRFSR